MHEYVIVSRHPAAIEFLRASAEFADAPVLASASPDDVRGRVVGGNIPLHLAALAAAVVAVEFDGAPPRGAEYGLEEMIAAGARLSRYVVQRI
ncbi:MAG: CRISPR-associated protein Csx16 [Acidiferrobacteraceae bacterium]